MQCWTILRRKVKNVYSLYKIILKELDQLPIDSFLDLDVRKTRFLDYDIIEILEDFSLKAKNRNIDITLISERGTVKNPESFIEFFKLYPTA